ncbi:MAG: 6-bladed beta-propeller [Mongoliitalea sp.]
MNKLNPLKNLVCLFLLACQSNEVSHEALVIPEESSESWSLSELVKNVEYVPLFGEVGNVPFEADKLVITEKWIFLGDFTFSSSIIVFEKSTGQLASLPLNRGEGPSEVREVKDFWVDSDILFVLDGVGRKILPIEVNDDGFNLRSPIPLEVPLRKFAKTQTGYVGLTGGGQEYALVFLNEEGKKLQFHLPFTIEYLMNPLNPFHQVLDGFEQKILLHTQFSPTIYRVDRGELEEYMHFWYKGNAVKAPVQTDFRLDQDGFNQFMETMSYQPSFFNLFEATSEQYLLFYIIQEVPKMALVDDESGISLRFDAIKNDLSFDQPFPKVIGVDANQFLAFLSKDQINQQDESFSGSQLQSIIQSNPDAKAFVLTFSLDLSSLK